MPSEDDLDCVYEYDSTWDSLSEEDDSPDDGDQCAATGRPQKYIWNYGRSVLATVYRKQAEVCLLKPKQNQDQTAMHWDCYALGALLPSLVHCITDSFKEGFGSQSARNMRAAKDMQIYRHGYPNLQENEENANKEMCNLLFYQNACPSEPDGVTIEEFHSEWKTNYRKLVRTFLQSRDEHCSMAKLFPLREPGMNYRAYELTQKEMKAFQQSEEAKQRLVKSYKLMLGFYGIELVDEGTGEVRRANNWEERYSNLNRNSHNNLRISRILKCLGELGFEHYQAPLVKFFLTETLVNKELGSVKHSALDYFLFSIRDKKKRRELIEYAYRHYESKEQFVWCPRKIQMRFKRRNTPGEKCKEKGGGGGLSTCEVNQCEAV
ncbi:opioid growth factor receptor-like [Acipenser ruthenus]|uniref:opioid growth factor receptor-like n=1 Tax=Acipenser ruthenus TaxID=7906 RepID=UPI0027409A81|nr:opioid growth factor receptor-like [Acipenser ruthenus]